MTWPSGVLQQAGPAQFECLIHFTGRPDGRPVTEFVPQAITDLTAQQKLDAILWDRVVWGFPPFGADIHHPMVCLSEHTRALLWLLNERHWQPWGRLETGARRSDWLQGSTPQGGPETRQMTAYPRSTPGSPGGP